MGFLNNMERKFGKYAVSNLTFWLLGAWLVGFIIQLTMPEVQRLLMLEPAFILRGQIWRLVSWLLIPPSVNMIFLIFFFSCYYFIGTSIEQAIGTFRYNVYLFSGLLCSILGAFLLYVFYYPVHYNVAIYGICRYLPGRRVPPLLPDPVQGEVDGDFRCGLDGVHVCGDRASGQGGNPFVLFEFYYFLFQHQELQAGIPQGNTQEAGLSAAGPPAEGSEQASVRYLRAHGGRWGGIGVSVLLKM